MLTFSTWTVEFESPTYRDNNFIFSAVESNRCILIKKKKIRADPRLHDQGKIMRNDVSILLVIAILILST